MKVRESFILCCFLFGIVSVASFEVFLGCTDDVRHDSFSDHLYTALDRSGIRTFRQKDGIPIGKKVGLITQKALESSKIAIVVFTKDFAKNIVCLDELVRIMELEEIGQLKLFPIYLYVNRSDIKEQTAEFYEAFALLESQFDGKLDIIETHRAACRAAAEFRGLSLRTGSQVEFIKKIVQETKSMLKKTEPEPAAYFDRNNLLLLLFSSKFTFS